MKDSFVRPEPPGLRTDADLAGTWSVLQFEGHLIRLVRFEFFALANCQGALVVIEPPTSLPAPDIVLGFGSDEREARQDAFSRAQARIENSECRTAVVA